ncbi:ATP-binding protein, partial [Chryseobacterium sp. 1B4]
SNLLKNAVKYNNEEGTLNIIVENNRITFQNSGSSVPLDSARIFNRFYKQGSDHTSTGLGLSIVKTIIRQYPGWEIKYEYADHMHYFILTKNNSSYII